LSDEQLHVVALSRQSADHVRASSLLGRFPVSVIPPVVDSDVFRPHDMAAARRDAGIAEEATVLIFAAQVLNRLGKGADLLAEALRKMPAHVGALTLLTVGHREMPLLDPRITHVNLGGSDDPQPTARAYACADLAVVPSRQEAFGQVVIEAMACGVPVVGFATGGICDAVTDGETGFVAPAISAESLRAALLRALADRAALHAMRGRCRQTVERRFAAGVVAAEYQALYRSLSRGPAGREAARTRAETAADGR
jgi:glycosyltransferase involved in cell wall biosynthesis